MFTTSIFGSDVGALRSPPMAYRADTKHPFLCTQVRVRLVPSNMLKPYSIFLMIVPRWCFFCGSFLLIVFHVCQAVLSVPCSLVVTWWERADLLALLYVMISCVFVTFPYEVLGQVWYLIVSIPDHCLLPYFYNHA